MTTPSGSADAQRPNVTIHANDHSVAAQSIGTLNVSLQTRAQKRASTAVLPVESLVSDEMPFIGRHAEIGRLTSVFDSHGDGVVIVAGPPGVGKSALTRQVVDRARGQFAHALFADLRGYEKETADRVQPDEMYAPLLRGLGVLGAEIPLSPAEQAGLYHRVMDSLASGGKPVLLWLDNVSERNQLDPLRPANPAHKLVVTTRETFGHIANRHVVDLHVLDQRDSVALMAAAAQSRNPADHRFQHEPDAAATLADLCDGLPLALQIVAALLADEPQRPITDLIEELDSEEGRLTSLHYDADLSVRAALTLSYTRLPDDLQRLFRLLSVVPGGDIGLRAAGWLIDASPKAVRPQLMALVRSHLIGQHVHNRWSTHDLVRLYSAEQSADHADDADAAFKRLLARYAGYISAAAEWLTGVVSEFSKAIFASPDLAAEWFEAERTTLIALVFKASQRAEYRDQVVFFGVVVATVLHQERHWLKDLLDVSAVILPLATQVTSPRFAAAALNLYGMALKEQGDLDQALEVFKHADQINEIDLDLAPAFSNTATVLVGQHRVDDAITLYRQQIKSCRESIPPNRFSEARTLSNLGAALATADRFEEAVDPLREAIALSGALSDLPGVAAASTNLGIALQQLAATRRQRSLLEESVDAINVALEIHLERRNASKYANAATVLGVSQLTLGSTEDGLANLVLALRYYAAHDQPERVAAFCHFVQSVFGEDAATELAAALHHYTKHGRWPRPPSHPLTR